jgi:glycosyltransferase XagB
MSEFADYLQLGLVGLFILVQTLYTLSFLMDFYLLALPVNWVDMRDAKHLKKGDYPFIVLLYPVLREPEEMMRTTFISLAALNYPADRYRIVAVVNESDQETSRSLQHLRKSFPFLEIMEVPPTTHSSWQVVWDNWDESPMTYWWHYGIRAHDRNLPPKKTRQLIYAFYTIAKELFKKEDFLLNYIDADSCPPPDHFLAGAVGIRQYDVLQATNVAGNLNVNLATAMHSFDHMAWDGRKYPHLSSDGRHPYWVLGKGQFFRASDLLVLGGFHPWIAIEDPEVGMRFWAFGRRLGIILDPLIDEVPSTFAEGILQRKRWVCGFFQSLGEPPTRLDMTRLETFKTWLNFMPCLSLLINAVGTPVGIWAAWTYYNGTSILPYWTIWHALLNLTILVISLALLYYRVWIRTAIVLDRFSSRLWYMLKVNPIFLMIWWLIWGIPIVLGFFMYVGEGGLVWERTKKVDANRELIRAQLRANERPLIANKSK